MIDPLGPELPDSNGPNAPTREVGSLHRADEKPTPPNSSPQGKGKEAKPASRTVEITPPAKALTRQGARPQKPSGFGRAVGAVRAALPYVQKLLPLLDGNVAFAAANFLAPQGQHVDLVPLESAVGRLQAEQRTQRGQILDQRASLQQVENELATVKAVTEQNAAHQRELAEHLLVTSRKLSRFTWIIIGLLTLSIAFNILVLVRMAYILRL
jgi:hypothetical protein